MSDYFPFRTIGFACNPFRALTDGEWMDVAILPEAVEAASASGARSLQILGAKGSGKTSALLGIAARFQREGKRVAYEHLAEDRRRFTTDTLTLDVFLLDEAQRLARTERDRLVKIAASKLCLAVSSHEDLSPLFVARGLPLTTIRLEAITESHLAAVLNRRLTYFALTARPSTTITPEAVQYLHATFGSDVRAIERLMYDVFQQLKPTGEISVMQLRSIAAEHGAAP